MLSQWLCDSVSVTRCNGVTCDIALVTLVITAYSSLQPGHTSPSDACSQYIQHQPRYYLSSVSVTGGSACVQSMPRLWSLLHSVSIFNTNVLCTSSQ